MSQNRLGKDSPEHLSFIQYAWNSLCQGKLWGSLLRWLRARNAPVPMSREAYRFDCYQRNRWEMLPAQDLRGVRGNGLPGLVSVVLPVYNGAAFLRQALDSLLAQTYTNWELIAVDDGSIDLSGVILDKYALNEPRMRVIHQPNQQLPRTLNAGFSQAQGEYLTWISCDNRMHPDFLEKMVEVLQYRPEWDAVYANLDLIGEDGSHLRNSPQYLTYQSPYGSEHIRLPGQPTELNVLANNTVGAAFLYRERVIRLVGEYNPWLHTVEDYDFWMRVNELLYLRHVPFSEAVYDYRFHERSLTSQSIELMIPQAVQRLMLWDAFRRDFNLTPCLWWVHPGTETALELTALLESTPLSQVVEMDAQELNLPELGIPAVAVWLVPAGSPLPEPTDLPVSVMKIIVVDTSNKPEAEINPGDVPAIWDARILLGNQNAQSAHPGQGWIIVPDMQQLCTVVDILGRRHVTQKLEASIQLTQPATLKATVVVCSHRRAAALADCLRSVASQNLLKQSFEVIVINNAQPGSPEYLEITATLEQAQQDLFSVWGERFHWLDCPIPGLSSARNVALWAAHGEVVCFLDDDAVADPDWLQQILQAFESQPDAGVVGGIILLREPLQKPWWSRSSWRRFWSHFEPHYTGVTSVDGWENYPWGANWAARRQPLRQVGGFRARLGRQGSNLAGGEEVAAASMIQELGYKVYIAPAAVVHHHVDADRFNWQYVWRYICSSRRTWYKLQAAGYVKWELGLRDAWRRIAASVRHIGVESLIKPIFTLSAELVASVWVGRDFLKRMRRPWRSN